MTMLLLLAGSQILGAQTFPALNAGTDARNLAMGLIAPQDAAGVLARGCTLDASVHYMSWAPKSVGTSVVGANAAYAIGNIALGLVFDSYSEKPYDITNPNGIITGQFKPSESFFGVSLAYDVADMISVGAGVKSVSLKYSNEAKGSAMAADIFAIYHRDGLKASVAARNFGAKVDFGVEGSEPQSLPSLVSAGAEYTLPFGLSAAAEFDYLLSGGVMAGLGVEYDAKIASVRAGYHYGDSRKAIPSYASLGVGVDVFGAKLDLTYLTGSASLGGTLLVGLGYWF